MFSNTYPIFEKKRLLKIEMLKNLRDYPRELFQIIYQNYCNGIVAGAQIKIHEKNLLISPGILYWNGIPYYSADVIKLSYEATETLTYLKVRFLEELQGPEQQDYLTQVYIDDQEPNERLELELARFKLQSGARLRDEYTDYFDFDTEFDTINRIHVPFAAVGKSTIWPEILIRFAKTLMTYPIQNPWDHTFCMICLQLQQGMPYEAIRQYLTVRLNERRASYSNKDIYQSLSRILQEAAGNRPITSGEATGQKKMLLL